MAAPLGDLSLILPNATFVVELIAFVVMVWILGRWAYPRIMEAAEGRQRQMEAALQEAERTRGEVAEALSQARREVEGAKQQASEIVARARREAKAEADEQRQRGRQEAEAQIERARSEIAGERDRAIRDVRSEAAAYVVAAAGQVLGQAIDRQAHERLIEESLERVTSSGGGSS